MNARAITMLDTIVPKSDQLNADDLIGGTRTITLTKVHLTGEEQPVALHFEGDNGKPYKPGKSMRRVLVQLWGPDANAYAGRSMTLFRDDKVMFGGVAVGGIRISHMTHIDRDITIALTTTRANRKPFTVRPLKVEERPKTAAKLLNTEGPPVPLTDRAEAFLKRVAAATTREKINAIWAASEGLRAELDASEPELLIEVTDAWEKRRDEIDGQEEPA